jgi:hypothetical protein
MRRAEKIASMAKAGKSEIVGNVTCPRCGHRQPMRIPIDKCQAFYKCDGCGKMIAAEKTCCVFCDYGDRKCPAAKAHARK